MTVEPIGIATLLVGFMSLLFEPAFIVYVFVGSTLLGSAGAFILESLGGTNIQPAHILLGFLIIRLLSDRGVANRAMEGITFGWPGFWLTLTVVYSVLSAYMLPRLFAGDTLVFPVRSVGGYKALLEPSTSNLTQTIYLIGDFVCFMVFFGYASSYSGQTRVAKAALGCAVLNLIFALLDLTTYYTKTAELLAFMRNSSYTMMSDSEEVGFKRIVGSFTEASTFSYVTIGYFGFTSKLWLRNFAPGFTATVSVLLLVALLFSTSTTAYVGLGVFLIIQYAEALVRVMLGSATKQMISFVVGAPLLLGVIVLVICLDDDWSMSIMSMMDAMIFNKMSTSSGIERSSWNAQAIQNFVDTMGFGTGNGSVRASSFPVALIASLGAFGALTYSLFLVQIWMGKRGAPAPDSMEESIQQAARSACLGWLIATSVSGGLIDLGLPFFILAALASARPGFVSRKAVPVELRSYTRA